MENEVETLLTLSKLWIEEHAFEIEGKREEYAQNLINNINRILKKEKTNDS